MHKKMLHVHEKVHAMKDDNKKKEALDNLWAAQCNCPYWHGVFGGLYLPHLRSAIYEHLIKAEKLADKELKNVELVDKDINKDGFNELILNSEKFNFYFDLRHGASIFEEDVKDKNFNLVNVLTRRKEEYHDKLVKFINEGKITNDPTKAGKDVIVVKEKDLSRLLNYDWYKRNSLVDHFFHPDTTLDSFSKVLYGEQGDFTLEPFEYDIKIEKDGNTAVEFFRNGHVWVDNEFCDVKLKKTFKVKGNDIYVKYEITNTYNKKLFLWHGVEFVMGLLAPNSDLVTFYDNEGKFGKYVNFYNDVKDVKSFGITDKIHNMKIDFSCDKFVNVWTFPIETVSVSESGFEKTYQGTVVCFHQKVNLAPGQIFEFTIKRSIKSV
jgi:alpha-amylase